MVLDVERRQCLTGAEQSVPHMRQRALLQTFLPLPSALPLFTLSPLAHNTTHVCHCAELFHSLSVVTVFSLFSLPSLSPSPQVLFNGVTVGDVASWVDSLLVAYLLRFGAGSFERVEATTHEERQLAYTFQVWGVVYSGVWLCW